MKESFSALFYVSLFILMFIDASIIIASYIYSRFIFNRYLKKYHREKWNEFVYNRYQGPKWLSFDKTSYLYNFRTQSIDDLGDPNISKMRTISKCLLKIGLWGLASLFLASLIVCLIAAYILKG